jgi:short-subunit dehydrogenase
MVEAGRGGSIVHISSILSQVVDDLKMFSVYGCSKAAIDMLTKCMALELGPHHVGKIFIIKPSDILLAFSLKWRVLRECENVTNLLCMLRALRLAEHVTNLLCRLRPLRLVEHVTNLLCRLRPLRLVEHATNLLCRLRPLRLVEHVTKLLCRLRPLRLAKTLFILSLYIPHT